MAGNPPCGHLDYALGSCDKCKNGPVPDTSGETLVFRLKKRAEIRRSIPTRKSVQEGQPDRIADLLEEAAKEIEEQGQEIVRLRQKLDEKELLAVAGTQPPVNEWDATKIAHVLWGPLRDQVFKQTGYNVQYNQWFPWVKDRVRICLEAKAQPGHDHSLTREWLHSLLFTLEVEMEVLLEEAGTINPD